LNGVIAARRRSRPATPRSTTFLPVTIRGTTVTVEPVSALGQAFDVQTYHFAFRR